MSKDAPSLRAALRVPPGPVSVAGFDSGAKPLAPKPGAMAHDRVPKYLAAMDIAVAPFRPVDDFYFSPLKLFEYLAMGKPVVASNVGQISELVRHGENGLLTAPGSVDALVAALDRLIADPATRERLASHTQDGIVTWHEIAQRAVEMARALQPAGSST